jgi:hypothetical protein
MLHEPMTFPPGPTVQGDDKTKSLQIQRETNNKNMKKTRTNTKTRTRKTTTKTTTQYYLCLIKHSVLEKKMNWKFTSIIS